MTMSCELFRRRFAGADPSGAAHDVHMLAPTAVAAWPAGLHFAPTHFAQTGHSTSTDTMSLICSCGWCGKRGATMGCRVPACPSSFHLPCARAAKATLYPSKYLVACSTHARRFLKEAETCVTPFLQAEPSLHSNALQVFLELLLHVMNAGAALSEPPVPRTVAHVWSLATRGRWQAPSHNLT